jgi:ribosomal-protein-alanine N-acetyltransferase
MQQVARPPEVFHTTRLLLRPATPADAPTIFARYAQDPIVTRYLTWRPHTELAQTEAFIQRCLRTWETGDAFPYAITFPDQGEAIGMVEIRMQGHKAEIGYVLAREFWGYGYTTEATTAVVDWAARQPGMYRVWALCDTENAASARVLEKVGMQREGILRRWIIHPNVGDEPRDCFCYALTK